MPSIHCPRRLFLLMYYIRVDRFQKFFWEGQGTSIPFGWIHLAENPWSTWDRPQFPSFISVSFTKNSLKCRSTLICACYTLQSNTTTFIKTIRRWKMSYLISNRTPFYSHSHSTCIHMRIEWSKHILPRCIFPMYARYAMAMHIQFIYLSVGCKPCMLALYLSSVVYIS